MVLLFLLLMLLIMLLLLQGFDKVGYLRKKDPHNVGGWKRRWFNLKGKSLVYYRRVSKGREGREGRGRKEGREGDSDFITSIIHTYPPYTRREKKWLRLTSRR